MDPKQVILITGCSSGFGKRFAETLARHGHTVYATMRDPAGRNAPNAAELQALAKRESLPLHVLALDVIDDLSVNRAVDTCVDESGRIDVAINNAGHAVAGLDEAVTIEQAQRLMDTNFFGSARVNRAVLPHMRKQRSGLLIHISSGAGRLVVPALGFYCASKFALEALAEAYHYELASQGIESCIVEPGAYQTSVFTNIVMAADLSRAHAYGSGNQLAVKVNSVLSARAGNPQDVADAILRIVETPPGQRQLRYRVSESDLGLDQINSLSSEVQAQLLEAFGITADTSFVQHSAASAH